MSTIKSSDEHLTLNADGSSKDIKFQANGVEKASISSAGAFTSTTIDATKLTGDLPAISGANLTGISSVGGATGVDFNDNTKARFGTGNDLEIYHDGTHSYIKDVGTGDLRIKGTELSLRSDSQDEPYINCTENGSVSVFYNNSKKFETTSDGVYVAKQTTGDLRVGNFVANGTGQGVKVAADSNQGTVVIENSLTSQRSAMLFVNGNGQVGTIQTNGSSTSYNTSSDYRLKENVVDMENATARLKQLKPKRFNFTADDSVTVDGFLAHEVSDIVPEAISGTKDEVDDDGNAVHQGIDQSKLVPLLVKTIQELEARITALEA